jgi:hypothetical protein
MKYVERRFDQFYARRGWGKPLLVALAVLIGYIVLYAVIVGGYSA